MNPQILTAKKWRKELKRRKLRAFRRRLMATCGPMLGNEFYSKNRKAAHERQILRELLERKRR